MREASRVEKLRTEKLVTENGEHRTENREPRTEDLGNLDFGASVRPVALPLPAAAPRPLNTAPTLANCVSLAAVSRFPFFLLYFFTRHHNARLLKGNS